MPLFKKACRRGQILDKGEHHEKVILTGDRPTGRLHVGHLSAL